MIDAAARIGLLETFGLVPLGPGLRDCWKAIRGSEHLAPTRWGLSSLRIFKPWISLPTWLGRRPADRRAPVYNLFNHVPAPRAAGYSVEVTYGRDFQGGRWTYDGHLGTDFACPVGTPICAVAPGTVVRVVNHMNRGGLKVIVDHGDGLVTTYNHLARALVDEGERVARGQPVALAGASAVDPLLFFPWLAPHLHLNVWLDGVPVDPYAVEADGEVALWLDGNDPRPWSGPVDREHAPTRWEADRIAATIDACRDPEERTRLRALDDPATRAVETLISLNFASSMFDPAVFDDDAGPCARVHPRAARLSLPFRPEDYVGAALPPAPGG